MGGIPIIGDIFAPPKPKAPKLPPPPPPIPTAIDPAILAAKEKERQRAATGSLSTRLTTPQGLTTTASTTKKTLLGS